MLRLTACMFLGLALTFAGGKLEAQEKDKVDKKPAPKLTIKTEKNLGKIIEATLESEDGSNPVFEGTATDNLRAGNIFFSFEKASAYKLTIKNTSPVPFKVRVGNVRMIELEVEKGKPKVKVPAIVDWHEGDADLQPGQSFTLESKGRQLPGDRRETMQFLLLPNPPRKKNEA